MKRYIFIFAIAFLFIPTYISACSKSEINRLTTIANNVDITYDYYYDSENKIKFSITLTNLHNDIKIYDEFHNKYIYSNSNKEITINDFLAGASYRFMVSGNKMGCMDEYVVTLYKTTPGYNIYSTYELCKGIEDYELCKKWRTAPISYEKFRQLVIEYKNNNENPIIEEEGKTKDLFYYIGLFIDFILKYNIYYIFALLGILTVAIILKQKDNFKIE